MEKDLRYTLTHIGDILVDKLSDTLSGSCRVLSTSTRGIILTYDIEEQRRKKTKLIHQIGERTAELNRISPNYDIFSDTKLKDLFDRLNEVETVIASHLQERESRLYPGRAGQNCTA